MFEAIKERVGDCKWIEIGRKGTGMGIFGSEEEASNAINTLDGMKFENKILQFDVWNKKKSKDPMHAI